MFASKMCVFFCLCSFHHSPHTVQHKIKLLYISFILLASGWFFYWPVHSVTSTATNATNAHKLKNDPLCPFVDWVLCFAQENKIIKADKAVVTEHTRASECRTCMKVRTTYVDWVKWIHTKMTLSLNRKRKIAFGCDPKTATTKKKYNACIKM